MELGEDWKGWKVVRIIGQGSFGTVYEIERDVLGMTEKAALKHITIPRDDSEIEELVSDGYDMADVSQRYDSYLKDIVREYAIMASLKGNPNIVDCDDLDYHPREGKPGWEIFIRMELLSPMAKVLEPGRAEEQARQVGTDICRALELCGRQHIVHRDIKPQNILLSRQGQYKLGDFGVAKVASRTTAGTRVGTFRYMAPEVYNGRPYGATADVYSLGLVLYWMLNRRRGPFAPLPPAVPTARQEEEAQGRRLRGDPLPPPADGSEELKRIVLKACAYAPEDRYHDAKEMLADLQALPDAERAASALATGDETVALEETVVRPEPVPAASETVYMDMGPEEIPRPTAEETVLEEKAPPAPAAQPVRPQPAPAPQPVPQPAPVPKKKNGGLAALVIAGVAVALLAAVLGAVFLLRGGREEPGMGQSTTISAGSCTVGLRSDGTVVAVGNSAFGRCDVGGWSDIMEVSTGGHTVGLRKDGTVVAVGNNDHGQCNVGGWRDITAVSAGWDHTVGLCSDGTVVAVGINIDGECDVSGWTDIAAVSAGLDHTVGLRSDGTVVAAGDNGSGQCDVSGWTDITAVSAGSFHTVGLRKDGTVVAVGYNDDGECDVSGWTDIAAVSAGDRHTVGLRKDGTVVAAGSSDSDACDVDGWTDIRLPGDAAVSAAVKDETESAAVSAAAEDETEPAAAEEPMTPYTAPTELGDEPLSGVVEYGGDLYQMPAPLHAFEKNGWTITTDVDNWDDVKIMRDGIEERVQVKAPGGNEAAATRNWLVVQISEDKSDREPGTTLVAPPNIRVGMSMEELDAILSEWDYSVSISNDWYYIDQGGRRLVVVADPDSETVESVAYVDMGTLYS